MTGLILLAALLIDALVRMPQIGPAHLRGSGGMLAVLVSALSDRIGNGITLAAVLVVLSLAAGLGIAALPLGGLWALLLAAALLGQRTLSAQVHGVADALRVSASDGRQALATLLGGPTTGIADTDLSRTAIAQAATRISSNVVAPVLWFLVAGLPGLLLSVTLTTAARYLAATGADRAHTVRALHRLLLWLPDRAMVALLALTHRRARIWSAAQVHGAHHGWPAAGLAALLDIAPGQGSSPPAPTPSDIDAAMESLWKLWLCLLALAAFLTLL